MPDRQGWSVDSSGSKSDYDDEWYKRRPTIMYDVINSINDGSDRGVAISGDSERLTSARKASCAVLYRSCSTIEVIKVYRRTS